jgi:hypothetical protein
MKPNSSPTTIPPSPATKPPQVSEPQVYHDTYAVGPHDPNRITTDRCTVGFWNLTDQDLTLAVQNQSRDLPRGKSLSLDLPREFVWQLKGREVHTERVATGESGMEIVFRKYKD